MVFTEFTNLSQPYQDALKQYKSLDDRFKKSSVTVKTRCTIKPIFYFSTQLIKRFDKLKIEYTDLHREDHT